MSPSFTPPRVRGSDVRPAYSRAGPAPSEVRTASGPEVRTGDGTTQVDGRSSRPEDHVAVSTRPATLPTFPPRAPRPADPR